MTIDYERMKRTYPKHKAALTRANNKKDPRERYVAVRKACLSAVQEWDAIGGWPDEWATWQNALRDAAYNAARSGVSDVAYVYELQSL